MPPDGPETPTIALAVAKVPMLKKKKFRRAKGQSPVADLICCCRFKTGNDKLSSVDRSPIYTARELSVPSLDGIQPPSTVVLTHSQRRPLSRPPPPMIPSLIRSRPAKNNSGGQFRIAIPPEGAFADDTPCNVADYLDCNGIQGGGRNGTEMATKGKENIANFAAGTGAVVEGIPNNVKLAREHEEYGEEEEWVLELETARTSRQEELSEYPPMDELIEQILAEAGQVLEEEEEQHDERRRHGGEEQEQGNEHGNGDGTIQNRAQEAQEQCCRQATICAANVRHSQNGSNENSSGIETGEQRQPSAFVTSASPASPASPLPATTNHHCNGTIQQQCAWSPAAASSSCSILLPTPMASPSSCPFPCQSGADPECQQQMPLSETTTMTTMAFPLPHATSLCPHSAQCSAIVQQGGGNSAQRISASASWRLAVSTVPQTVTELVCMVYVWMASSVAFLLEWFF